MKWGFTGSQRGTSDKVILKLLKSLKLTSKDTLVTGACIGLDAQIAILAAKHYPKVPQLIIYPGPKYKVDKRLSHLKMNFGAENVKYIFMKVNTTYRMRNERLVEESDKIIAFWTGVKRSGTYMTMNIAKKVNKLEKVVRI